MLATSENEISHALLGVRADICVIYSVAPQGEVTPGVGTVVIEGGGRVLMPTMPSRQVSAYALRVRLAFAGLTSGAGFRPRPMLLASADLAAA